MDKLKELKEVMHAINEGSVTTKDLQVFIATILEFVKNHKNEFLKVSQENLDDMQSIFLEIEKRHDEILNNVDKKTAKAEKEFSHRIQEVKSLVNDVKSLKFKDGLNGKDGKDADEERIIASILSTIRIPESKQETGKTIIDKINELPADKDNQIDASHIKNLPQSGNFYGGSGIKEVIAGSNITIDNTNLGYPVISSTGGGGGTWGSILGTLSNQTDLQNALNAKQNSLGFTPENVANKSTSVSTDGTSDTKYPSVKAIKDYADSLVAGLLDYRGGYDASVNTFPTSGGSGTAGAISKGDMFIISIAGTLGGTAVQVGDSLIASVDTPAQTASNWNILNSNITYVPEDIANKDTDVTLSLNSDTKYPTQKAVKTYVDLRELSSNKSTATTLGASDILYPTQKAVKTYIDNSVSTETENAQSGTSYTFALTDGGKMVTGSNSSPTTFTVPTNSSIGFPIGTRIDVLQIGTGKITIANSVGVTLLSQGGNKTIKEQYVACTLWKKDTDLWYLMGNLQA